MKYIILGLISFVILIWKRLFEIQSLVYFMHCLKLIRGNVLYGGPFYQHLLKEVYKNFGGTFYK